MYETHKNGTTDNKYISFRYPSCFPLPCFLPSINMEIGDMTGNELFSLHDGTLIVFHYPKSSAEMKQIRIPKFKHSLRFG